ncbi:MAG: hypothetical protein HOM84_06345 [Thiotrichales bacterium]|jgi:hypothetical protein|nr:hypothetical protein [Thiotrichales bacterium]MBT3612944.1 hypothetical protein [Thiotrichales bacterium]MBT3752623.1 hypothetical protein [Thiotrichales bacterium]MBT3837910.1 hypothetical protein [Thiotrichales bacterium]MBT4151698.1 hypothetical protein [Thiotrichales bacterium]
MINIVEEWSVESSVANEVEVEESDRGDSEHKVRIEIDAEMLNCILSHSGLISAAEIRCLDCISKKCVQKMILKNLMSSGLR